MRDIRFRVWDGKRMIDPHMPDDYGNLNIAIAATAAFEGNLMQYTGLHDKNGKEIWEGDLVFITKTGWMDSHETEVVYENGSFVGKYMGEKIYDEYVEVVGNIYENPTLTPSSI